jgi:glutathione synthase/RimK-type ligase-like ATP-grasp enzyme
MADTRDVFVFFIFRKHKTDYYNKELLGPLRARQSDYGLRLHQGSLKDLHIEIIDNKLQVTESMTGKKLDQFDLVYFELWLKSPQQALAAATYLERRGRPFIGHETLNVLCSTKIGELVRMSDSGLPLPRTFMSSLRETLRVFKQKNPPLEYPFIAKAADTFGGQMNYLVKSYSQLKKALQAHPEQFFVLQEFIPNDCDYRILIMGGEVQFVLQRTAGGAGHINNTSAGGEGKLVPINSLTEPVLHDALRAAGLTLRSDFAGVDVLLDKNTGQHYILEVNEAPAIQMGAEPEQKIAIFLRRLREMAEGKNG